MTLNERQEAKLEARGRIHWFDQKTNIFYKLYKKGNLLDSAKDLKLRLCHDYEFRKRSKLWKTTKTTVSGQKFGLRVQN